MSMPTFLPPDSPTAVPGCPLCREAGGTLVFQSAAWRVIRADEPDFPAFYRVVWRAHVAEWSELALAEQAAMMGAVTAVERVLRDALAPAKVNLASLGNVVPQLHVHVIARFTDDPAWPRPIWGVQAPQPFDSDEAEVEVIQWRERLT